ncbi:MAG TPA: hypothetical protein VF503_01275 [Sphingobium sp.]|uniref:hypothetical protein n=1 Tax=Sphingobium sp. TaxID=1912891 RepID=UPI002ED00575
MPKPIDIAALRREAEGEGKDVVPVTRRWLKAMLAELEGRPQPALDHPPRGEWSMACDSAGHIVGLQAHP